MKTRNYFLAVATLLTAIVFVSFRADRHGDFQQFFKRNPETRANMVTMVMKNSLSMDDAQVEKAYQINLKYAKMLQPYFEKEENIKEVEDEVIAVNKNRKDELREILTQDQLEQAALIRGQWITRLEKILEHLKENDISNK